MKGRALAAKQEYESAVAQAWSGEAFARQRKLRDLKHYLGDDGNSEPVMPEVILDAMLTLQSAGVPMTIKKLN